MKSSKELLLLSPTPVLILELILSLLDLLLNTAFTLFIPPATPAAVIVAAPAPAIIL